MALRINTNVDAICAQRSLGVNQTFLSKTLERLSTGLRINRAADDAAGLAISEKLRTQIRGYSQAIANTQDGINMIQTTEGAINEDINILHRIRELAIQAANDTLTNKDREKIQEEITQLRLELTSIATKTEFNTRKLLDGSIAGTIFGRDAEMEIEQNVRVGDTSVTIPSLVDFIDVTSANTVVSKTGVTVDVAYQLKFISTQASTNAPISVSVEVRSSIDGILTTILLTNNNITQITLSIGTTVVATLAVNGNNVSLEDIGKTALVQLTGKVRPVTRDSALTFHTGPNEGQFIKFGVEDMTAKALRLEAINIVGTNDEDSRVLAQNAIGVVDQALDRINALRARLGALQNRLESTIRSMQISQENLMASESRIRDADVAKETTNLTKAQILVQAGTAVLAQANLSPQNALSLLR